MRCHYEVLEVSRDAEESEIKTAYRKLALKFHPDKNLNNPDFAKEQFQIVQQAYEVLSDRQERAWYDKHREQILRGSNSEFEDKSLDVFQYFTATCFNGYGDDENGFYTVYRKVFEKLAKEDMEFMEDKEEFFEIPNFGNSETDFEKIAEFYAYWLNYSTKKSYFWLDPYDITELRARRDVKLVEKENKKIRQKAKKERNEEVRNLVAFVRKRDKRVKEQKKLQEQKLLENKKKREKLSKEKRLERQKELASDSTQPEWAKFDNVKSELEEIEKHLAKEFGEELSESEEEDLEINDLYCVACSKLFKTTKAFQNHESSKKHKENVEIMKGILFEEEDHFEQENYEEYNEIEDNSDVLDELLEETNNQTDSESVEETAKNKKKKKKQNILTEEIEETKDTLNIEIYSDDDNFDICSNKKQKKKNKKNSKPKTNEANGKANSSNEKIEIKVDEVLDITSTKKKRDRKIKKEIPTSELQDIDTNHNCVICNSNFLSKNKLFDHLKKTGHSVYIPPNVKNKAKKNTIK